jgi:hypothetical protein
MPIHLTSDLKRHTGKILDAARKTPQFVVRDGFLYVITVTEPAAAAPCNRPPGYFNEPLDNERLKRETVYSRLRQVIDR